MHSFRNILYPTNFTTHSRTAMKYAAAFAKEGQGRVVLLNAQSSIVPPDLLSTLPPAANEEEDSRAAQLRIDLKNVIDDPVWSKLTVEPVVVEGEVVPEISKAVADYDIDLITLATRGRKGLSRAWGSSLAEDIIATAPCPVLAIRQPQREFVVDDGAGEGPKLRLTRILLAINFRPASTAAAALATQISSTSGAELHAVYVIGDYFDQLSAIFPEGGLAALTRLRTHIEARIAQLERFDGRGAITHIVEGRPYEEIIRAAERMNIDLIVVGAAVHGSIFGGGPVLGSEVERVVRNAPCPVLCVPAARVVTPHPVLVTQTA